MNAPTEIQDMLRDSVRRLLAEESHAGGVRAQRANGDGSFDTALWRRFAEMGWTTVVLPSEREGMGYVGAGLIAEAIGSYLIPSPFLASAVLGQTALLFGASTSQCDEWLPKIAAGSVLLTVAVDEGGKHNPEMIEVSARPTSQGVVLDGKKTFVLNGDAADAFVIAARSSGAATDQHGITLCLVMRSAIGVFVEKIESLDSHFAANITFHNVEVGATNILGKIDGGHGVLQRVLNAGRACLAAELSGIAQEAFKRTLLYLQQRIQFERPIGSFQALQHRAAIMHCEIELMRSAVQHALQSLDSTPDAAGPAVSLAKAKAGDVTELVVSECLQMHGGMGMTDECDIGLFVKRARVAGETFGNSRYHARLLADHAGF